MWISFVGRRKYKLINWTGDKGTETFCSYFITELFETETHINDDLQGRQRGRYNEERKTTLFVSGKMKKFRP